MQALRGVSDLLIRLHSLHEQEGFVASALASARRRALLAGEAHERGLTDARAVLEAQSLVFEQQRLQQRVHAGLLAAQAELWVALGGGVLDPGSGPRAAQLQTQEVRLHVPGRR
ncbi:hypothetical protein D3C78_1291330 [compost metagenome]